MDGQTKIDIIASLSAFLVVASFIGVVWKFYLASKKPIDEIKARLDHHEATLNRHDTEISDLKVDNSVINEKFVAMGKQQKKMNTMNLKTLLALVNHARDGSNGAELDKISRELTELLIDKASDID